MKKAEEKHKVTKRGRDHRFKIKSKAIEYLGGKCVKCSYNKCIAAFDFHHIDPNSKDIEINKALSNHWGWNKLKIELDKCILLCANCHRELHNDEILSL